MPARVYGEAGTAYLAEMVPALLSTWLTGTPGLETKVQPTTFEVEKVQWDLDRIARAYGARNLVLANLACRDGRIELQFQVVDGASRDVRWAGSYQGPMKGLPLMTAQAAEAMLPCLAPQVRAPSRPRPRANSFEAEMALEEGRYHLNRFLALYLPEDATLCQAALERALALDPRCAAAAGNRAHLEFFRAWTAPGPEERARWREQAATWARRALELDPGCGLAWAALAQVGCETPGFDLAKVLDLALRAAWLAPREPSAQNAVGGAAGGPCLMAAAGRHIHGLDPFDLNNASMGAFGLAWSGRPGQALALMEGALRFSPSPGPFPVAAKVNALFCLGRTEGAMAILVKGAELGFTDSVTQVLRDPALLPLRSDPRFPGVLLAAQEANRVTLEGLLKARDRGELPVHLAPVVDELRMEIERSR